MVLRLFSIVAYLLAAPPARADQIKALTRGDHSLAAFYQAIASAQSTIDVTTYEFEPCHSVTKVLLDAISKKARSGVKVRMIVEAYTVKDPRRSQLAAWLEENGKPQGAEKSNIELRVHGTSVKIAGDIPRSHSKILVVDGGGGAATLITGGRNLTDEYFGLSAGLNYLDQDLLVRGPAATDAWKYYNELWESTKKVAPQGDAKAFASSCLAMSARDRAVLNWVQTKSGGVLSSRRPHSCPVDYEVDNPDFMSQSCGGGPGEDFLGRGTCFNAKRTTAQIIRFLKGTRNKLEMENQYYFPWGQGRETIDYLREHKRTIEIFGNATGGLDDMPSHDKAFTCYIQRSGYQTFKDHQKVLLLTSKGALRDSWELSQPGATRWRIHTKTAIRDDRDVLVASWNFDPRSYQTNLETGAVVTNCPGLAADIEMQYEQLRRTAEADKNCAACEAEFVKSNLSDTAFCGGTPTFY